MLTITIEVPDAPIATPEGDQFIAVAKDWPDRHVEYGRGKTQHGAAAHALKDMMEYRGLPVQCAPDCEACIEEDEPNAV